MPTTAPEFSHSIRLVYSGAGITVADQPITAKGSSNVAVSEVVPASTTDMLINLTFPFASVLACGIGASKDVTVKTNSSSVPDDTLEIKSIDSLMYIKNGNVTNPFTADVTKLYVTNASTEDDAIFKMAVLLDATP